MKKVKVNGAVVRQEREKRAWTQEELSERSNLGVRTLRRLEAGQASLDTIRRVAEALELKPEETFCNELQGGASMEVRNALRFDPLMVEFASDLVCDDFPRRLIERIVSIRRHIAAELGFVVPGVRVRDLASLPSGNYRLLVREVPVVSGQVYPGHFLAIAPRQKLDKLEGVRCQDPTYGMPATWISPGLRPEAEAEACMIFDTVSVIATHLTRTIRFHARQLLGIEDVSNLLEGLELPRLVAEVIPARVTLVTLRAVLQNLLGEDVSIRDLPLILETLADHGTPQASVSDLTEAARTGLAQSISQAHANHDQKIMAIVLDPAWEKELQTDWEEHCQPLRELLSQECQRQVEQGLQPLVVVAPALRRPVRELCANRSWAVLAYSEISERFGLERVATLSPR